MSPEEALRLFEQTTGLRVFAVLDRDGTAWWAKTGAPVFECTIGDRVLHIDELAAPDAEKPGWPEAERPEHCGKPVGEHMLCARPRGHGFPPCGFPDPGGCGGELAS